MFKHDINEVVNKITTCSEGHGTVYFSGTTEMFSKFRLKHSDIFDNLLGSGLYSFVQKRVTRSSPENSGNGIFNYIAQKRKLEN